MKKNRNQPIREKKRSAKQLTPGPGTRYYEKRKGLGTEGEMKR